MFEAQSAADEAVSGFSLTLPAGTSYTLDGARLTLLTGADLMTRESIDAQFSSNGQTISVSFPEPAQTGGYFRIELRCP